ncbi:putative leader peptide [Streptomyces sp. NPDC060198]|uniref:putative leader peptide n=1 Tax=Streptomyces sp. NPDC060198 TaxID=3347070 RepID=UPI00365B0049
MPYQQSATGAVSPSRLFGVSDTASPDRHPEARLHARLHIDLRRSSSALCPA